MIRAVLVALLTLGAILSPAPGQAQQSDFRQIESGQSVTLQFDRAYILLRCSTVGGYQCALPMLLRVPTAEESRRFHDAKMQAWQKKGANDQPFETFPFELKGLRNLYFPASKRSLDRAGNIATVLIETMPGEYVVYGMGIKESMVMCFCLGTVAFNAPPGSITDAGTFFAGRASSPSPFPELAEVTNLGGTMDMDFPLAAGAIRPLRSTDPVPPALQGVARSPAHYRAIGPYLEPAARGINRLAPIPGILAYDRGNVIDVQSGQTVPAR